MEGMIKQAIILEGSKIKCKTKTQNTIHKAIKTTTTKTIMEATINMNKTIKIIITIHISMLILPYYLNLIFQSLEAVMELVITIQATLHNSKGKIFSRRK